MSDGLLSVEEMAEIPKDFSAAQGKAGCSKGVNLFLARQKLIADMMEQEDSEQADHSAANVSAEGGPSSVRAENSTIQPHSTAKSQGYVMISAADQKKRSAEAISEIPDTNVSDDGGSKSKGVNLFLARQKLIADMMAAEEEEERAAEDAKRLQAEEERNQEELRRKQEAERIKMEELKKIEREKFLESERKKSARAAKFRTSKPVPTNDTEPDLPWVKKKTTDSSSTAAEPRKTLYQLLSADKKVHIARNDCIDKHNWNEEENSLLQISESPSESTDDEVCIVSNLHVTESNDKLLELEDFQELSLPKSQLPAITLLQKSRGGACSDSDLCSSRKPSDDMHKIRECLTAPALYSGELAGEIPKGALYVGTNERIEGGYKHTDQFFLVPALDHNSNRSCQRTRVDNSYSERDGSQQTHKSTQNTLGQTTHQENTQKQSPDVNNNARTTCTQASKPAQKDRSIVQSRKEKPAVKKKPVIYNHSTSLPVTPVSTSSSSPHGGLWTDNSRAMVVDTVAQSTSMSSTSAHGEPVRALSVDTDDGFDNPFASNGSQSTSRSCSIASNASLSSPSIQYKEIQKGGDIPFSGLRKPPPVTPPPRAVTPPTAENSNLVSAHTNSSTSPNTSAPPECVANCSEEFRGRPTYRSEYRTNGLVRSLSRGRQANSTTAHGRTTTHSPPRSHNLYIVRQNYRRNQPRPTSLHLDIKSTTIPRRRYASGDAVFSGSAVEDRKIGTFTKDRTPSPVPSWSSNSSSISRTSNRPLLVIVPPAGSLSNERSRIQEGTVQKKPRNISAVEELNIRIPYQQLNSTAEIPRRVPSPVAGYDRSPAPIPRVQRDRSDAKRRELMSKVEQDERRKKAKEEEAQRRARRHSDYFTLKEKSPIPHDRYDGSFHSSMSAPQSPARSTTSQNSPRALISETRRPCTAIALYLFNAQHPRELTVYKDDTVLIKRRVDGNWYEATKDGKTGIIPVTYLQITRESSSPPPPVRPVPPNLREGCAVAKYNFNPQTSTELALRRGDQVSLIKRVDPNWYEGRLRGSTTAGIFPVSYVQVISEPVLEDEPLGDAKKRTSMLMNRSQSVPYGSSSTSVTSPQYHHPTGHTPSSGYGSGDQLTSPIRCLNSNNNNNNIDDKRDRASSTVVNQNGHTIEESDFHTLQQRRGLEMPSYKSLYNYEPHNDDELQLKKGDIVHIIEKCADGWFVGTSGRTGLFGTFPGNYVTPV